MFQYLIVAIVASFHVVSGQSPVTVCQPPVYQVNYSNAITGDTGYIAVDYTQDLRVEVSSRSGKRVLYDFKNLYSYEIINNSSCNQTRLSPCRVQQRCLPSYATLVPSYSSYTGNPKSPYYITITTWDVLTEFDVSYRHTYTVNSGESYWPVMTQERGSRGIKNLYFFTNQIASIKDTKTLIIPTNCELMRPGVNKTLS
ncbi:hypothetical protein Btru_042373 [Bulinus truncatus]|nr:hypothetical protein Btru_042373 [Bulinus truncatus]